ncbi:hypothetical protein ACFRKE_02495 [Kitasatospora indigofera]|uniref:hypothetical protein n=1 Tax=Kitasatospora indigofera TaxID=67307 RepID=UPI0036BA8C01
MPDPFSLLRPAGSRPSAAGRVWRWVPVLVAALALMLSHGLDGETPTGHLSAVAHALPADGHHAAGHEDAPTLDAEEPPVAAVLAASPADDDHHGHASHTCLAAGPSHAPPLPSLWPAPTVAATTLPEPSSPTAHAARRALGGEQDRPAGIEVLRV